MKKSIFIIPLIILFPLFTLLGQEQIDVIYLNNGDIAKGLIVENVPDDYVKIELFGGSVFTFKYSEILVITKEEASTEKSSISSQQQQLTDVPKIEKYENGKKRIAIMLNTGLSIPFSTEYFSDYWSTGYNFGAGIEFYLNSQLALQGYIEYNNFSFDVEKTRDKLETTDMGEGGDVSVLNLTANVKYNLPDITQKILPYILGGLGYSSLSITDLVVRRQSDGRYRYTIGSESVSTLSINFGFGVEFMIYPSISIFADARYILIFNDSNILNFTFSDNNEQDVEPYTLKENTSYIPLRVGVSYSF